MLATAFATAAATFGAGASAEEVVLAPDGGSKEVVESDTGSYIVVMEEDPVVVTVGQDGLDTPVADGIAADLEAEQNDVLADIGGDASDKVNTYTSALNGFSAAISYEEAQALAANPKVALVLPDELHQATNFNEGPNDYLELGVRGGAWQSGLTGENVIVGVIDNGIWPEHPSFADDGSYPPLPDFALDGSERPNCEFGNTAHNPDDVAFSCNNKLLGGRQMLDTYRALIGATPEEYDSARDDDGHGTHTASTAAGNAGVQASMYGRDLGEVSGIAPRAHASSPTRVSACWAASHLTSLPRSIRPSSTAWTSSTTRSAAVRPFRSAATTSPSCSQLMPVCSSPPRPATAAPVATPWVHQATPRG